MYFPKLNDMRRYQIDELSISQFDIWLGTRRRAIWKYLSPLDFSFQTGLSEDIAMHMFAICVQPSFELLKPRYVIECPRCESVLQVYNKPEEIPPKLFCDECEEPFLISENNIIIWFTLIQEPSAPPYKYDIEKIRDHLGKERGLRATAVSNSKEMVVRRLLDGLDHRGN